MGSNYRYEYLLYRPQNYYNNIALFLKKETILFWDKNIVLATPSQYTLSKVYKAFNPVLGLISGTWDVLDMPHMSVSCL